MGTLIIWEWKLLKSEAKFNVYLGLGSNIGDRENYLETSIQYINNLVDTEVLKASSIYETEPVGYLSQDKFLNMVILISTSLSPQLLLCELLKIEKTLKRNRIIHWGPRTIDLDILIYGDLKINENNLIIPHERLFERAFVLIPLKEVYREIVNIDFDKSIQNASDKNTVVLYKGRSGTY
jgi:2-amino-4-hydroxy-6-hydroxymethyldihydropteridine diphosphokinase